MGQKIVEQLLHPRRLADEIRNEVFLLGVELPFELRRMAHKCLGQLGQANAVFGVCAGLNVTGTGIMVGRNPVAEPAKVEINEELALKWLQDGAKPSDTVRNLFSNQGIMEKFHNAKFSK